MSTPIKCDHCNKRADAKVGDVPEYLCADCWLKFYANKPVHGEHKRKVS
mgnify:CR=1 FL=1